MATTASKAAHQESPKGKGKHAARGGLKPESTVQEIVELPQFDRFDLHLIDTLSIEETAKTTGMAAVDLGDTAELGLLPPWIADVCPDRGWIFHPDLTQAMVLEHQQARVIWVPNTAEDVAEISLAWLDTQPDSTDRRKALLSWMRCAEPDTVEALRPQFVWWCCHYSMPSGDGSPPLAIDVARRWETLSDWYEMLTEAGVGHSAPHIGTAIAVVTDETLPQ